MSKPNPEKLFDDISAFIDDSRKVLDAGGVVQLTGLDERVELLCHAVLQLSDDERVKNATRLKELVQALQALGETIAAERDAVAESLRGLSGHRQASVAYSKAEVIKIKDDGK